VIRIRTFPFAFLLVVGVASFSSPYFAQAASCEAFVGQWEWFTGGVVTINPDGTMVHAPGNDGTWECTDSLRGRVTLRWRVGGYVNRLALSTDGQGLFSMDPSQMFVTAKRVGTGTEAKKSAQENNQPLRESPSDDSQEIAQLVERLNQNYKDTLEFDRSDSVHDDDSIRKALSIALEADLTLVKHYLECSMPNSNWLPADDPRADYRMSADSVSDCDKQRHGLKWKEKTEQAPLARIESSSIKLSKTDKDDSSANLTFGYEGYDPDDPDNLAFDEDDPDDPAFDEKPIYERLRIKGPPGFVSIECKSRTACEQMATDLKRLVEIARRYAAQKAPPPQSRTVQ